MGLEGVKERKDEKEESNENHDVYTDIQTEALQAK